MHIDYEGHSQHMGAIFIYLTEGNDIARYRMMLGASHLEAIATLDNLREQILKHGQEMGVL